MDVASGADRHLDITFRLQVVESSSLVSLLFRDNNNYHNNQLLQTGFLRVYLSERYITYTTR